MSFLPYANASPTVWAASVGGSSILHGGLAVLLLTSSVAFLPPPITNQSRAPEFEVTLEILDADIIDALEPEEEESLIPPDAVALTPETETADLLEESELAALTPDEDVAEPLAPSEDVLAPVEEEIAILEPEAETLPEVEQPAEPPAAEEPVVQLPEAVIAPEPVDDIMAIDDISPIDNTEISPLAEAVAPAIAPALSVPDDVVTLQPDVQTEDDITAVLLPDDTATPAVVLPENITPEVVEPDPVAPDVATPDAVDPETTTDPVVTETDTQPNTGAPQVVANPDANTVMIGALLRRIRATPAPQCTLALPRRAGPDGVGVSFIGAQTGTLDTFATQIFDGLAPTPIQTREIIDPRQCALLDAVRQISDYPAGRVGLSLTDTTLQSGENLTGRIVGAGGLYITLLLIDDNGIVQDMSRFTTIEGNDPVFDAPVARSGPARATRQVLLALGSPDGPIDVSAQIGLESEAVFAAIPRERLENIVFGLATFDVR